MSELLLKFLYYPELTPGYRGTCPSVFAKRKVSTKEESAIIARCAADAAVWAAGIGLPRLTGKRADVRAAEIFRAEWVRQKRPCARGFHYTQVSSASSWLAHMDHELRDD